jgi:secondary thiamine-phosphate synthase enzyme
VIYDGDAIIEDLRLYWGRDYDRDDLEAWLNRIAPEDADYWTHTLEGPDDMPAHAKAALLGASVTVPIAEGRAVLGTWQGIHLCELRNNGGPRRLSLTLSGEAG